MSANKHHSNYTLADINDYLQGRLSPAEMHAMEKAALQDPFLADALEGLHGVDAATAEQDLANIHTQLQHHKESPARLVYARPQRNWLRIAAAVVLLAGAATIGWYVFKQNTHQEQLASQVPLPKTQSHDTLTPPQQLSEKIAETKESTAQASTKQEKISQAETREHALAAAKEKEDTQKEIARRNAVAANAESDMLAQLRNAQVPQDRPVTNPPAPPPPVDSVQSMLSGKAYGVSTLGNIKPEARKPSAAKAILPPGSTHQFSGIVVDKNARPIGNATIVAGTNKNFMSDAQGRFTFSVPDSVKQVQVSAVGFQTVQTELLPLASNRIVLNSDRSELNEVVVTGYSTQKKKDITGSVTVEADLKSPYGIIPASGWTAFYTYLSSSIPSDHTIIQSPTTPTTPSKPVQLELLLDASGKPTDVVVSAGFKRSFNKKLIIAIKNGPVWHQPNGAIATGKKKLILYFAD